jgi:hypothetical protein
MTQEELIDKYIEMAVAPLRNDINKMKNQIIALKQANENFIKSGVMRMVCACGAKHIDNEIKFNRCVNCGLTIK